MWMMRDVCGWFFGCERAMGVGDAEVKEAQESGRAVRSPTVRFTTFFLGLTWVDMP